MNNFKKINKDELLENIFDNTLVGMLIIDENSNIQVANSAFYRLYGYTQKELEHQNTKILHINNDYFTKFKKLTSNKRKDKEPLSIKYEFKKKDGSTFWANVSSNFSKINTNTVWMITDINEIMKPLHN